MRTVELDFTQSKKNIGEIGYVGENNETELLITPPAELSEDSAVASYRVAFGVNGEIFHSAAIPAAETFTCLMWGDTTQSTSVTIQLEATDSDGELIAKSQMVVGCLAPSVQGEETDNQFEQPILNEIAANTAARHTHSNKAVLDAIIAPPIVEISETETASKYLPNELVALVQAGTALTYQNNPIIQYTSGLAFDFAYFIGTGGGTPKMCFKSVTNLGRIKDNNIFGFSSVYYPLSVNYKSFSATNNIELKAEDITASSGWTPPYADSLATKKYVDDNKGDKLPAVTSSDEDKVLTVNSSGQWVAAQPQSGSGGSFIITITNVGGTPTADKTESEIYQAWTDGQAVFVESNNYRVPMIFGQYENSEYSFYFVSADIETTVMTYYAWYSTNDGWELDVGSYAPPVTDVQDSNGTSVVDGNGVVTLADVALSGSYADLSNKPTIPSAQVQSDWNEADNTKADYIKNKPDLSVYAQSANLATVATSGDYDDLLNKPTIPTVPVTDVQVNGSSVVSSGVASVSVPSQGTITSGDTGYATGGAVYSELGNKQNTLTAGTGISIVGDTISATGGSIPSGTTNNDMLFWDNDNSQWIVKPRWQAYYQPVQYIESSGTQHINTGVDITTDLKMVLEKANVNTNECIEGAIWSNNNPKASFSWGNLVGGTTYKSLVGSDLSTWADSGVTVDTNKHTFEIESGSQKIDGVQYATQTLANKEYAIGLFGWNGNGSWTNYSSRLYSCKFYKNGVLIRDFIPCYNVFTGEVGLFDKANSKFYGNSGTGTFTKGADV